MTTSKQKEFNVQSQKNINASTASLLCFASSRVVRLRNISPSPLMMELKTQRVLTCPVVKPAVIETWKDFRECESYTGHPRRIMSLHISLKSSCADFGEHPKPMNAEKVKAPTGWLRDRHEKSLCTEQQLAYSSIAERFDEQDEPFKETLWIRDFQNSMQFGQLAIYGNGRLCHKATC